MNTQIIKNGPPVALVMSPSTVTGLVLADNSWCCATVANNAIVPPVWIGANGDGLPGVGANSTIGSGTLSQPAAGNYTLSFIIVPGVGTNSEQNSKLFMFTGGQLLESQMFDLVDTATPPPAPIPVPTLTATPSLVNGVPSIILSGN